MSQIQNMMDDIHKNYSSYFTQLENINKKILEQMLGEKPIILDMEEREKVSDLHYMFREIRETEVTERLSGDGKILWLSQSGEDMTELVNLESVAVCARVNYESLSNMMAGEKFENISYRHSTLSKELGASEVIIPLKDILDRKNNNLDISGLFKQLVPYSNKPKHTYGFIDDLNQYISGFDLMQNEITKEKNLDKNTENTNSTDDKKNKLFNIIKETAESYTTEPEKLAELFEFGSRFYSYSIKNTMLIYNQNPYATYVQSFDAWKKEDCYVKKGQRGLKVFVPVKCTYLNTNGESIPLRQATKEQVKAYKQGHIKGEERLHFKIGTVFDISQTTFPKERYPELFSVGYPSEQHKELIKGLIDFANEKLNCTVVTEDLKSIALRGDYSPFKNLIRINNSLEDTEKLSTLSHELGHALIHHVPDLNKTESQMEFEADALSIMIQSHYGIDITDSRKRHLAEDYKTLLNTLENNPVEKKDVLQQSQDIFSSVYNTFRKNITPMQECIKRYLPEKPELEQKETQNISLGF